MKTRRPPGPAAVPADDPAPPSLHAARRRVLQRLATVAAATLVAGCSSLVSRPAPVKRTFLLDPPLPQPIGGAPKPLVLRMGTINVAAPFRGKQFVYRQSELGYASDYYDEWFVPPGTMLADAVAKGLAAARVFERVVPSGAAGNEGDYLLDGFVSGFYGDAREGRVAAELDVTFYLTAVAELSTSPVWTHTYAQRATMGTTSSDALAQALNVALGAVLRDLSRDLAATALGKRS